MSAHVTDDDWHATEPRHAMIHSFCHTWARPDTYGLPHSPTGGDISMVTEFIHPSVRLHPLSVQSRLKRSKLPYEVLLHLTKNLNMQQADSPRGRNYLYWKTFVIKMKLFLPEKRNIGVHFTEAGERVVKWLFLVSLHSRNRPRCMSRLSFLGTQGQVFLKQLANFTSSSFFWEAILLLIWKAKG